MKSLKFFSTLLFLFHLLSCDQLFDSSVNATGKVGEILVVCDEDLWNSPVKKYLDSGLTKFIMPYFPDVVTFELIHKTKKKFEGATKRHRNILFVKVDPKCKSPKGEVVYKRNVWSNRQLVVKITARNKADIIKLCENELNQVHNTFDEIEWNRIRKYFAEKQNSFLNKDIAKNFSIHIDLPDASNIVSSRTNFFRIALPVASRPIEFVGTGQQDMGHIYSGLMIYQYPYEDSTQLSLENLLAARDTMLRYNVPHESEGLFMGTQYNKFVYPEMSDTYNYNGTIKGIEMRGMFVFKGRSIHTTGGAFWAFHFIHPKTKKIVCLSGYVDAPSTTSWTHFLREIEAIWKSVTIL